MASSKAVISRYLNELWLQRVHQMTQVFTFGFRFSFSAQGGIIWFQYWEAHFSSVVLLHNLVVLQQSVRLSPLWCLQQQGTSETSESPCIIKPVFFFFFVKSLPESHIFTTVGGVRCVKCRWPFDSCKGANDRAASLPSLHFFSKMAAVLLLHGGTCEHRTPSRWWWVERNQARLYFLATKEIQWFHRQRRVRIFRNTDPWRLPGTTDSSARGYEVRCQ